MPETLPSPPPGHFADRLCAAVVQKKTPAMVGIDPRWDLLPGAIRDRAIEARGSTLSAVALAYDLFSGRVLDAVADLVGVVKFQMAFFESAGPEGLVVLSKLTQKARSLGLIVVLDGKRSDIGNTAAAYAQAYLGQCPISGERPWFADALTVSPYLGEEGVSPFLQAARRQQAGVFVLVRTSNPGAGELQDARVDRPKGSVAVHQIVADWVEAWAAADVGSRYGHVGAVVGATVPEQLSELRGRMPHAILLVPGFGAQGGSARDVAGAFHENGLGAVVNNSRGILYAYRDARHAHRSWDDACREATREMVDSLATMTPAGKLR